MRAIKFRGRTIKKQWLYGNLIHGVITSIISDEEVSSMPIDLLGNRIVTNEVNPMTVGQYAGTDKNGKDIYEGDILRTTDHQELLLIVAWNEKQSQFGLVTKEMWKDRNYSFAWRSIPDVQNCGLEIVGNIHDNPEMLEE